MIHKLAIDIADVFVHEKIVKESEVQVYAYSFELLISTIINFVFIFTIAAFLHIVIETILFLAAFIPLRILAGGFHAKTHWFCILVFTLCFYFFVWLALLTPSSYLGIFILIEGLITFLTVLRYAPVEAENKPLSQLQKFKLRRKSLILTSFNLLIALCGLLFPYTPVSYYTSGALAAAISLVVAVKIKTKGGTRNEKI
jgi:accessory gene regulator B